ncbi:aspartyl protease family protein [uncultured Psychroserpens sp.]|uniref:aspartyl protease family protein n=1 Tax=uncultured Psychroserpens sp. TaxID=255436 RepID=UPI00261220A9|nr:aspartyl protease family protein [uncultured Psychroserpens sp.]
MEAHFKLVLMFCFIISMVNAQDTIPFSLGPDNRIYIKASVNDSKSLDFIFDTGANGMVVNTTVTNSKLNLKFDSSTQNTGANGTIKQKVSTGNTLRVGKFERKQENLLGIPYPETYYSFDGVIGYPFFEDYLIEINYELQQLVLHASKTTIKSIDSYEKLKMTMMGEVPYIDFSVFKDDKEVIFPAMIDTGFNGILIVYYKTVEKFNLKNRYKKIRESKSSGTDGTVIKSSTVTIPKVMLGKNIIENLPVNLNLTPTSTDFTSILGGKVLKKFNWIIDFKGNTVFIKTIN